MKNDKKKTQMPKTTVSFYGKKRYSVSPVIVRKPSPRDKLPDYSDKNDTMTEIELKV